MDIVPTTKHDVGHGPRRRPRRRGAPEPQLQQGGFREAPSERRSRKRLSLTVGELMHKGSDASDRRELRCFARRSSRSRTRELPAAPASSTLMGSSGHHRGRRSQAGSSSRTRSLEVKVSGILRTSPPRTTARWPRSNGRRPRRNGAGSARRHEARLFSLSTRPVIGRYHSHSRHHPRGS